MSEVTIPLSVTLDKQAFESITKNIAPGVQPIDVLSRKAQLFFQHLANGGVMLKSDQVTEIERNSGKAISSGDDVVRATEAPAKKASGRMTFEVSIDPTWTGPLQEIADTGGRTIDELISDMFEIAMENQWCYGTLPQFPPVYIGDYSFIQEFTGRERPTGEEIVAAIKDLQSKRPVSKKKTEVLEPVVA